MNTRMKILVLGCFPPGWEDSRDRRVLALLKSCSDWAYGNLDSCGSRALRVMNKVNGLIIGYRGWKEDLLKRSSSRGVEAGLELEERMIKFVEKIVLPLCLEHGRKAPSRLHGRFSLRKEYRERVLM